MDTQLPLSDIRVLDLTRVRAGPTAVRQLADWGADVIKVELPGNAEGTLGESRNESDFQNLHRNKRSITLNLKVAAGLDVFKRLANSTDARLKYSIYKTNADFLLVSIGIFDNPLAPTATPLRAQPAPAEEAYIGRGKTYYHFAYTYAQQVHRKNQGVSEVLEKLSVGFEKYIKILSHMRGEYLDLVQRFSEGEVYHLERAVDESARQDRIKAKQDQLLELYSQWQQAPTAAIEEDVKRIVGEIQELAPSFRFSLPTSGGLAGRPRTAEPAAAPPAAPKPRTNTARTTARSTESTATGVAPEPAPKRPRSRRKKSD